LKCLLMTQSGHRVARPSGFRMLGFGPRTRRERRRICRPRAVVARVSY